MKINHDLRHRITVVEAQGKALIEQKVELEAYLQTKEQEMGALRSELGKLREKLQGEPSQNGDAMKVAKDSLLQERRKFSLPLQGSVPVQFSCTCTIVPVQFSLSPQPTHPQ